MKITPHTNVKMPIIFGLFFTLGISNFVQARSIMDELANTEHLDSAERVQYVCPSSSSKLCKLLREDINYRDTYLAVADKLNKAKKASDNALIEVNSKIKKSEESLNAMKKRALKLPDGTPIFRDKYGQYHREDGSIVDVKITLNKEGEILSIEETKKQ